METADLRAIYLFAGLRDAQLADLLAAGAEVPFDEGHVLFREGQPADFWWVLVDGRVDLIRRSGHEESVVGVMDKPGVWAGGFRAWAEEASYLATGRGAVAGRMLRVPAGALEELAKAWFPFGVHLIEGFFQTVRNLEALARQRESLVALGTLAAGLAHELNNPAAAAARSVDGLKDTCRTLLSSLAGMAQESLGSEQFLAIDALRLEIDAPAATPAAATGSLELADREEALFDWLSHREIDNAWRIAPPLAASGVGKDWLERAAAVLPGSALGPGLEWVASTVTTASLLAEIKESTARISALVGAVKSYSELDRASLQTTDVTEGIESTLVMLAHKLGDGIDVVRDFSADLPPIEAIPGELNQVWTNLIDNALDAMGGRGTLRVSTGRHGENVVVEIADTGTGMTPAVQARAFDPFYTTKDVGKGTGLGLDISRRIVVERHHGEITIESGPNGTILRVSLPLRDRPVPEDATAV